MITPDEPPFQRSIRPLVTEAGIRLWHITFFGKPVGWSRRPEEVDELNAMWRVARAKRQQGGMG